MIHTFNLELGNQVDFKLAPEAFCCDLPKKVPVVVLNKNFLALAEVRIENGEITFNAEIPDQLFTLAPVPVFEVDEEDLYEDGVTPVITKANLLSISLMPHKKGDTIKSLQLQQEELLFTN